MKKSTFKNRQEKLEFKYKNIFRMINMVDSTPLLQKLGLFSYLKFQIEVCHMSVKQ